MQAKRAGKLFENLGVASEARRKFLEILALLQIIYFQYFQGQNIYFQKVPATHPENQMVVP